jgi:hypothetical protein
MVSGTQRATLLTKHGANNQNNKLNSKGVKLFKIMTLLATHVYVRHRQTTQSRGCTRDTNELKAVLERNPGTGKPFVVSLLGKILNISLRT